ncbi:hypothetical protein CUR178_04349 [Leishmania enriettii]|uniref:Uncharacterized protein n=1 Tax=Leishmania enriettii TaxID=5663 RepID=A0A836GJJ4_LEIEN|nr:hypothetical protein CUR178_04349 [Leishmania enriettii]
MSLFDRGECYRHSLPKALSDINVNTLLSNVQEWQHRPSSSSAVTPGSSRTSHLQYAPAVMAEGQHLSFLQVVRSLQESQARTHRSKGAQVRAFSALHTSLLWIKMAISS